MERRSMERGGQSQNQLRENGEKRSRGPSVDRSIPEER
jgi:hypothetical protein